MTVNAQDGLYCDGRLWRRLKCVLTWDQSGLAVAITDKTRFHVLRVVYPISLSTKLNARRGRQSPGTSCQLVFQFIGSCYCIYL
jgi:hypothetical protein